jgi:hypothetical protein
MLEAASLPAAEDVDIVWQLPFRRYDFPWERKRQYGAARKINANERPDFTDVNANEALAVTQKLLLRCCLDIRL